MKIKNIKVGKKVTVYDRYRFAIPLKAEVVSISIPHQGVKVKLSETNNPKYPVGSETYVFPEQLRKCKS